MVKINKEIRENKDKCGEYELIIKTNIKRLSENCLDLDTLDIYDTPGTSEAFINDNYSEKIHDIMVKSKLILFMVPTKDIEREENKKLYEKIKKINNNVIIIANKIDKYSNINSEEIQNEICSRFKCSHDINIDKDLIYPISAKKDIGIDNVLIKICNIIENSKQNIAENNMKKIYKTMKLFYTDKNDTNSNNIILRDIIKKKIDEKIKKNKKKWISMLITSCIVATGLTIGIALATIFPPLSVLVLSSTAFIALMSSSAAGSIAIAISTFSGFELYNSKKTKELLDDLHLDNEQVYDKIIAKNETHTIYSGYFCGIKISWKR